MSDLRRRSGLLPPGLRRAYPAEQAYWDANDKSFPDEGMHEAVYDTPQGLLVPVSICHCGEEFTFDGTWNRDSHRRCIYIP